MPSGCPPGCSSCASVIRTACRSWRSPTASQRESVCEVDAPQTSAFVVTAGERSTFVTLSGDFDILTARAVTSEVETFLVTAPTDVVFDLSALDFIDSSGIALLLKIHSRVVKDGCGSIRVVHASDAARRTFELCGLTEAFGFDITEIGDAG